MAITTFTFFYSVHPFDELLNDEIYVCGTFCLNRLIGIAIQAVVVGWGAVGTLASVVYILQDAHTITRQKIPNISR